MRKYILLFSFFLILCEHSLYSEGKWRVVDSLYIYTNGSQYPKAITYVGIACADSLNCVVFGNHNWTDPINRVTSDGGKTWETTLFDSSFTIKDNEGNIIEKFSPTKVKDVVYPSKNLCMAVCDSGYYYISRDNCKNWEKGKFDTPDNFLFYLNFYNENIGVVANVHRLFYTTNNGYNWQIKEVDYKKKENTWVISDAFMVDENTIILTIYDCIDSVSYVYKTFDLGNTWEYTLIPYKRADFIFCLNKNNFWLAGGDQIEPYSTKYNNLILYTTDGGETWEKQLDTLYAFKRFIHKLYFTDENNGFALTQHYIMWKTTNGGKHWYNDTTIYPGLQVSGVFADIAPISENKIFGATQTYHKTWLYEDDTSPVEEHYISNTNSEINIFPNPVNHTGEVKFVIEKPTMIEIKLYDILGNLLQIIYKGYREAGINSEQFSLEPYSSGVYYLVMTINEKSEVKKLLKF